MFRCDVYIRARSNTCTFVVYRVSTDSILYLISGYPVANIYEYPCACTFVQSKRVVNIVGAEFLICFEAWAKLAQQWLLYAPLGIHLEPINKELMLLVTI